MRRFRGLLPIALMLLSLGGMEMQAQRWRRFRRPRPSRSEFPTWKNPTPFNKDVFTFVRLRYDSLGGGRPWAMWEVDYPDADWNFSFRLQQLTSFKVDPNGLVLRINDPRLFNHPFVYAGGTGLIHFSPSDSKTLRKYLLSGGFLMMDDFWSEQVWEHVYHEMKKIFPNREPRELSLDHPIFHTVFDLKKKPQVIDIHTWQRGLNFEYWGGGTSGDGKPHFWGYFDDRGRLMALLCHNNDLADGWEREGENKEYFKTFSEKMSYPMGIKIISYVMTH